MNIILGIFVILHGLVHAWYITLNQGWVEFQPEMGWTGQSWLLSDILNSGLARGLSTALYSLGGISFVIAGIGLLSKADWTRPWLTAASLISAVTILLFWDGSFDLLVQKGLLGLLINLGILAGVMFLK